MIGIKNDQENLINQIATKVDKTELEELNIKYTELMEENLAKELKIKELKTENAEFKSRIERIEKAINLK